MQIPLHIGQGECICCLDKQMKKIIIVSSSDKPAQLINIHFNEIHLEPVRFLLIINLNAKTIFAAA